MYMLRKKVFKSRKRHFNWVYRGTNAHIHSYHNMFSGKQTQYGFIILSTKKVDIFKCVKINY